MGVFMSARGYESRDVAARLARCALAGLVGMLLLLALPAQADDATERQARVKQAQQQFERGKRAYNLGRFEAALEAFSSAYELKPVPELLFNLGQCHKKLHNHERALFFFESYLREKPDAPNREQVEALIKEIESALQEEQTQQAQQSAQNQRASAVEDALQVQARKQQELEAALELQRREQERAARDAELAAKRSAEQAVQQKLAEQSETELHQEPWFWVAVSGAAVVAVAAGVTAVALVATSSGGAGESCGSLGCLDGR